MVRRVFAGVLASASITASATAAELPIYDATQVAFGDYTIVKRVWAETWRSWFWVGGEANEDAAKRSLVVQAEKAGANALVNVTCMARTDGMFVTRGHYCYGDAVRTTK